MRSSTAGRARPGSSPPCGKAPGLRWIHARSAGLDRVLVPEVVAHPAVLTNGRGAFSPALAEFVLAALLFFAKDLRRLVAQQAAGAWEPFDMERLEGRTVGIVGYGDIGRAVASRLRPLGVKVLALRRRPELSRGGRARERDRSRPSGSSS